MTRKNLEKQWRSNLSSILEELSEEDYEKLLFLHLDKIPGRKKDKKQRGKMPQIIIQRYGLDMSIKVISKAMDKIPRKDRKIQDLIQPMLQKLEDLNQQGKKRKSGPESEEQQESPSNDPGSPQSEKNIHHWRQSIKLLKESRVTDGKPVGGKIIQKCALRTYETKEKQEKKFFHLAVADETDCIKVMVYGEELFNKVEEGRLYLFTDVEVDVVHGETVMKVIKHSKISKTNGIKVPKTLELQSPFLSIKQIKSIKEKTAVSVEGTVIEIDSGPQIEFQKDGFKVNTREFKLEDKTGSIWIKLWRNDIEQLRGRSVGDLVRVTNLLTNHCCETVSLNSTDFIRIHQVKAAAVQNVTMQIVGIIEAGKEQSELDVLINQKSRSFFINSRLLAEVFGVKVDDDFEDKLLEKIPFSAKGKIKQNKIQDLEAAKAEKT